MIEMREQIDTSVTYIQVSELKRVNELDNTHLSPQLERFEVRELEHALVFQEEMIIL